MNIFQKHHNTFKWISIISLTSGSVWVLRQVQQTREILDNAIDTSIIDLLEPIKEQKVITTEEFSFPKWIEAPRSPETSLNTTWNSLKFIYARRLLNLTNSDNKSIRLRAIKHLAAVKKLENWQYSLLAHTCDAETSVGLARVRQVNPRLFLQPPLKFVDYDHTMLVNEMKDYLTELDKQSNHVCLKKFINQAFVDESHKIVDQDFSMELAKFIKSESDVLLLGLQAILHHTETEDYAKDIICKNGLYLLMEIYNRYKSNLSVNILLSRMFSNISVFPELLGDIYTSGWIGILSKWLKDDDIRISLPAACALTNLDYNSQYKFDKNIFTLHPVYSNSNTVNADVVLVHGLLGGVFFTWRQRDKNETTLSFMASITVDSLTEDGYYNSSDPHTREYMENMKEQMQDEWDDLGSDYEMVYYDIPTTTNDEGDGPYSCNSIDSNDVNLTKCWPKDWLPEDCPNIRIIGVNYETSISTWTEFCPHTQKKRNLDERSNEMMMQLLKAGVGDRPIVWITHSMGGLLVKNILNKAWKSGDNNLKKLCMQSKGIVFYSTPHFGSKIANLSHATSFILWPSIEVRELRLESSNLLQLHEDFLKIAETIPIKIISFVETKATIFTALKLNFLLVEPYSGNPNIGEYYEIPQDHLGICKPANRHSFLYQKIVNLLRDTIKDGDKRNLFPGDF